MRRVTRTTFTPSGVTNYSRGKDKCACGRSKQRRSAKCRGCHACVVFADHHVPFRHLNDGLCRTCGNEREPERQKKTRCLSCAKKDADYAKRKKAQRDAARYEAFRESPTMAPRAVQASVPEQHADR
jgi:hypothetical protein